MLKTKTALSADVLQVLSKDNYEDRSVQVKDYLITHDLWDIVEETNKPPQQEDDGIVFHAWSKKNSIALQVIKNSCKLDTLFEIWEINSAKVVWNTLAEKYLPENTNSGLSLSLSLSLSLIHMHAQNKYGFECRCSSCF